MDRIELYKRALERHSVLWVHSGGRLYAENVYTEAGKAFTGWTDVTDWTTEALYNWLGH